MEKQVIQRMRMIVKDKSTSVQKDFKEDQKDLRTYSGNFLWGLSQRGTNLIFENTPFSYLQIEDLTEATSCYVCIAGHLKKVSKERAMLFANGLFARQHCA